MFIHYHVKVFNDFVFNSTSLIFNFIPVDRLVCNSSSDVSLESRCVGHFASVQLFPPPPPPPPSPALL